MHVAPDSAHHLKLRSVKHAIRDQPCPTELLWCNKRSLHALPTGQWPRAATKPVKLRNRTFYLRSLKQPQAVAAIMQLWMKMTFYK